uniref:Ig-like domain-containing protein n=1 Tax=Cyprinodon variegatus TaxID=28743 RepID=A0A3Q2DDW3_CYPVA
MWDLFPVCTKDFKLEVKTVTAGHNITLTCPRQSSVLYPETYYWIRLVSGKWPEFLRATFNSMDDISKIRHIQAKQDRGEFLLEINEAWQNDTGLYYCIKVRQLDFSFVKGTLLKIEGQNLDVNVVLQNPSFGPHHAGNPEALQCSVLSNSERSTCPADNRVYWFRAGSDDSHPSLLYLQGNSLDECEKSLEAPSIQKCFYNFSETVDPGTYYCAVAACGQILFGSGAKLNGMWRSAGVQDSFKIVLLIVTFWLIYKIKSNKCGCCNGKESFIFLKFTIIIFRFEFFVNHFLVVLHTDPVSRDILIYSAPTFKRNKDKKVERRNVKPMVEETVYTDVKTFQ